MGPTDVQDALGIFLNWRITASYAVLARFCCPTTRISGTHISRPSGASLHHPPSGPSQSPELSSCATQRLPTTLHMGVHVSRRLQLAPPLSLPSLCPQARSALRLQSALRNRFIRSIFLDSTCMLGCMIRVLFRLTSPQVHPHHFQRPNFTPFYGWVTPHRTMHVFPIHSSLASPGTSRVRKNEVRKAS